MVSCEQSAAPTYGMSACQSKGFPALSDSDLTGDGVTDGQWRYGSRSQTAPSGDKSPAPKAATSRRTPHHHAGPFLSPEKK